MIECEDCFPATLLYSVAPMVPVAFEIVTLHVMWPCCLTIPELSDTAFERPWSIATITNEVTPIDL